MRSLRMLDDRYRLLEVAGRGGMATVYRAIDEATATPVAVKVVGFDGQADAERFGREVAVHSEMIHPFVVRCLANGLTEGGELYLVMEWLDGETLAQRLSRGPLSLTETLSLGMQVAVGLRAIHQRGVVHRDIKPSNLFLVNGRCEDARILDFGIARHGAAPPITVTGGLIGSVGYMAPEQLQDPRKADAKADIFSVGCVLYECLAGQPAYAGKQGFEVMNSMLRGEILPIRQRVGLPPEVEQVIGRTLARDPSERIADGAALVAALEHLLHSVSDGGSTSSRLTRLTVVEQKLVSLVLFKDPKPRSVGSGPEELEATVAPIRAIAEAYRGHLFAHGDGVLALTFAGERTAHDRARRAAECAIRLRRALGPRVTLVVAMGPMGHGDAAPTGPVVERSLALLASAERSATSGIVLDDGIVGFLGEPFDIESRDGTRILRGEAEAGRRHSADTRVSFVGRERELTLLEQTLEECAAERVGRAILVTGEPGIGKSRLCREFRQRVRTAELGHVAAARAQPLALNPALSLVRQLLRSDLEAHERNGAVTLHERVHTHFDLGGCSWLCELIGELLGEPPAGPPSAELRAARSDPRVMSDWMQRAVQGWASARSRQKSLVILLDDIQWADRPSLALMEHLLTRMGGEPLLLVACGRPDPTGLFASLWESHHPQHVRLTPLTRSAAERLVAELLMAHGCSADPTLVAFAVEKGSGNPLHLEELVRHAATSGPASVPTAVLSMLVARLEQLEPDARRTLRAASILGRTFDGEGIGALAGVAPGAPTHLWLEQLALLRVIEPRPTAGTSAVRYSFRHDLLREAAYSLLTEHDRTNGHRLAGEWLEGRDEVEPLVVAEHYLQGDAPSRAIPWLLRAAQQAIGGGNLESVLEISARGLALDLEPEARAALHAVRADAYAWRGDWPSACAEAARGFATARPGTPDWWATAGLELFGGTGLTPQNRVVELVAALASVESVQRPDARYARAMHCAIAGLLLAGQRASAEMLIERVHGTLATTGGEASYEGWLRAGEAVSELYRPGADLAKAWDFVERAHELFSFNGDALGLAVGWWYRSWTEMELGLYADSVESARRALSLGADARSPFVSEWSWYMEASAALFLGSPEGETRMRALIADTGDRVREVFARGRLALHLAGAGRVEEAEAQATAVLQAQCLVPIAETAACTALAQIAVHRGQGKVALAHARRALEATEYCADPIWLSQACLVRVEALYLDGSVEAGAEALDRAVERIEDGARHLGGRADWRAAYLGCSVHSRTFELARQRGRISGGSATLVSQEASLRPSAPAPRP